MKNLRQEHSSNNNPGENSDKNKNHSSLITSPKSKQQGEFSNQDFSDYMKEENKKVKCLSLEENKANIPQSNDLIPEIKITKIKDDNSENIEIKGEISIEEESYSVNMPKNFVAKPNIEFSKMICNPTSNIEPSISTFPVKNYYSELPYSIPFYKSLDANMLLGFDRKNKFELMSHDDFKSIIPKKYDNLNIERRIENYKSKMNYKEYLSNKIFELQDEMKEIEYNLMLKKKNAAFLSEEIFKMKIKIHFSLLMFVNEKRVYTHLNFIRNQLLIKQYF